MPFKPHTREADSKESGGFLSDERGQLVQDYALGISLFLITMAFVAVFIPNLLTPFSDVGDEGELIKTERTADHLLDRVLVEQTDQTFAVLDRQCTAAFFSGTVEPECPRGDEYGEGMSEFFGLRDFDNVNITVVEPDTGNIATVTDSTGTTTELRRGDSPPEQQSQSILRRKAIIDGDVVRLRVVVW